MKKRLLYIMLTFSLVFSGCYGYKDMNKVNFVASGLIDEDESGNVILYSEVFSGDRGATTQGATSKRIVLEGRGATINQAFYTMQRSSTYPMAYDVMKALIFTERLAKHGLTDHLDTILRNQRPTIKIFAFILEGDPVEFLSTRLQDEEFIGIFLEDMMVMQKDQQEILPIRLNEFYNERIQSGRISLIPTVALCQEPEEKRITTTGAAILKEDKMVGKLDTKELAVYQSMINNIKESNLTIENPEDRGHLISLLILKNKAKQDIEYDGEKVILKMQIDLLTSIMGIEGNTKIMDKEKEIVEAASKEVEKRGKELFYKFQEQNIDLFHIGTDLSRKYPNVHVPNILENAEIELDVRVKIESSQNITDFQR
ncbi:Ger(x)C family germination protein [Alkalibaculum bacchi]|uniref:Ger(X)C family germination protein n=1 Tax=Alkalibaculum bacchi TaxID=645887 RepID=A0A366IB80_9FIRM|nr:Ger(x)C family spore germination protein [Alkalibaculum bacchi]RBP65928.1 Ger(x)C family germination protein [Alkalibaculum bacchi]